MNRHNRKIEIVDQVTGKDFTGTVPSKGASEAHMHLGEEYSRQKEGGQRI